MVETKASLRPDRYWLLWMCRVSAYVRVVFVYLFNTIWCRFVGFVSILASLSLSVCRWAKALKSNDFTCDSHTHSLSFRFFFFILFFLSCDFVLDRTLFCQLFKFVIYISMILFIKNVKFLNTVVLHVNTRPPFICMLFYTLSFNQNIWKTLCSLQSNVETVLCSVQE